jgi:hypothetical protein
MAPTSPGIAHDPTAGYGAAGPWSEQQNYAPGGPTYWGYGAYAAPRTDPLAISSLVLGLVSFLCLGFITGTVGIGLGIAALNRIKNQPQVFTGKGLAIAGIVLGGLQLAIFALLMAFGVFAPTMWGT